MRVLALVGSLPVLLILSLIFQHGLILVCLLDDLLRAKLLHLDNILALVFLSRAEVARDDHHIVEGCCRLEFNIDFRLVIARLCMPLVWHEARASHVLLPVLHLIVALGSEQLLLVGGWTVSLNAAIAEVSCWGCGSHLVGHLLDDVWGSLGPLIQIRSSRPILERASLPGWLVIVEGSRCDALHMNAHSLGLL